MVGVSASVNPPLHHKVPKFSSGTDSSGWSQKKGRKMVEVVLQPFSGQHRSAGIKLIVLAGQKTTPLVPLQFLSPSVLKLSGVSGTMLVWAGSLSCHLTNIVEVLTENLKHQTLQPEKIIDRRHLFFTYKLTLAGRALKCLRRLSDHSTLTTSLCLSHHHFSRQNITRGFTAW